MAVKPTAIGRKMVLRASRKTAPVIERKLQANARTYRLQETAPSDRHSVVDGVGAHDPVSG